MDCLVTHRRVSSAIPQQKAECIPEDRRDNTHTKGMVKPIIVAGINQLGRGQDVWHSVSFYRP